MAIMTKNEAVERMNELFVRYAPRLVAEGWKCTVEELPGRAMGLCHYGLRRISISPQFLEAMTNEEIIDVVKHEIAHALTPGDGHGKKWRAVCRQIGCRPRATKPIENRESLFADYKYLVVIDGTFEVVGGFKKRPSVDYTQKGYGIKGRPETYGKLRVIPNYALAKLRADVQKAA